MQTLFNSDYTLYSGSVVNNPHGHGIHGFVGAFPPTTFHHEVLGTPHPPFVSADTVVRNYYGKNVYDKVRARGKLCAPQACLQPTRVGGWAPCSW
jgi:hypothetical protein